MPVLKQSLDTPENNMPVMSNSGITIDSNVRQQSGGYLPGGVLYALRKGSLFCQVDTGNGVSTASQSAFYCTHSITHQLKTMSSGGIYWEVLAEAAATSGYLGGQVGLVAHGSENSAGEKNRLDTQRCSFIVQMSSSGSAKCEIFHDTVKLNSATGMTTAGANLVQGDVINFAVRYDGKVFVGINGTWVSNGVGVGNPATGANQLATLRIDPDNEGRSMFHYTPACGWHSGHKFHFNFGSDGSFDGSKTSGNNTDANTEGNEFLNSNQQVDFNLDLFFKEVYPLYTQKYSYLKKIATHNILEVKIQRTRVGEGYHTWHCENAQMKARNRILAFMVYLNDVTEGGETEFLYQKCRFKPEKNTLLVWPSQFTHIHRGNPPLSNDKYIITGWVEYGY